jgi:hypothetical protein
VTVLHHDMVHIITCSQLSWFISWGCIMTCCTPPLQVNLPFANTATHCMLLCRHT